MPVGGRINREQERVSAGPGHRAVERRLDRTDQLHELRAGPDMIGEGLDQRMLDRIAPLAETEAALDGRADPVDLRKTHIMPARPDIRSEEHTSELQSLMRHSYAAFCLKKQNTHHFNSPLFKEKQPPEPTRRTNESNPDHNTQ